MDNSLKNYPPLYNYPDMPVDVASVLQARSLSNNINAYSSRRGPSSYQLNASGPVITTYTGAATALQYLATIAMDCPALGPYLDLAFLAYVSAASRFRLIVLIMREGIPYIGDTSTLQTYQNYRKGAEAIPIDNTDAYWESVRIPYQFEEGENSQIVLAAVNISGVSASFYLAHTHQEWSEF